MARALRTCTCTRMHMHTHVHMDMHMHMRTRAASATGCLLARTRVGLRSRAHGRHAAHAHTRRTREPPRGDPPAEAEAAATHDAALERLVRPEGPMLETLAKGCADAQLVVELVVAPGETAHPHAHTPRPPPPRAPPTHPPRTSRAPRAHLRLAPAPPSLVRVVAASEA